MRFSGSPVLMVAEVETADGISIQHSYSHDTAVTPSGVISRAYRHEEFGFYRSADYRPVQPGRIPVLHRHDRRRQVGTVEYLKWVEPDGRIVAVCEVDGDEAAAWLAHGDSFISPGVRCRDRDGHREDIELDHLALVEATARVAARPVRWAVTSFEERRRWANTMPQYRLLVEAAEARRKRRGMDETLIVGHPGLGGESPPLFRDAGRPIHTATSPFEEKVGAAVRAGVNPFEAMWEAGGRGGAMLWDGPGGVTYGIH
jgi:hypothetical protein